MNIEIKNISKKFGEFDALKNVDLTVHKGELLALLGPSGCGKTTLLRIIAGLESPDSGEVILASDKTDRLNNNVGFVFQHYALFKHMNVFENIAFGLRVKPKKERLSPQEIDRKVWDLLNMIQIDWAAKKYPDQLSGGQRQRVALARALAIEPQILLLDEPFGALDAKVRKELRKWLRQLHDKLQITSIFVTHDQEEALELADRIVVMDQGEIIQTGSPRQVYENPATSFVYMFLGNVNRIKGKYLNNGNENNIGYVRPHDIKLSKIPAAGLIESRIKNIFFLGSTVKIEIQLNGEEDTADIELTKETFTKHNFNIGDTVYSHFEDVKVYEN